ncbi:MAG TPA: MBL fold metallo-hydrolase [Pyrinomonadaceae bacterium]|jgi:glyoxylase-like metal-dependent hydrolase (beta-lactamase superfamily II)/rhodanese-related sulfurtransferase|nr:MBL fold metallo-hydrolase [Pyrinomonadaceae bacterium]
MYFKQFYLGCLAHASYLIGSEGEAAVVDPQRDVDEYINEAAAQGLKIKYVIETHLHADFVSGHRELAARTGAEIVFGKEADATFPHRAVQDGDEITIGKVGLRIMETPGHTPESISVLITEAEGNGGKGDGEADHVESVNCESQKILTGDTLFVGDVGRPDLAGGKGYTPAMMAALMFDTLHGKLLKLDDATEVYPAHGAGSMCGKNMSKETSSTIGEQRRFNYALQPMSKDEFVRMMTVDLSESPAYFPKDAEINRTGAESLDRLPELASLTPEQVRNLTITQTNSLRYVVLDLRTAAEFGAGHVPGSLNIGLGGQFAIWAGTLIPLGTPIIIVSDSEGEAQEAVTRLARVGHESVKGFLAGGIAAWSGAGFELATVPQITVVELNELLVRQVPLQIVDVRRSTEYQGGHVPGAVPAPLLSLQQNVSSLELDPTKPIAVICAGGYRSSAATSILRQHGFADLLNVAGGTSAWVAAGYDVEVPSTQQIA